MESLRRVLPVALLAVAGLGSVVLVLFTWGLLREYADLSESGAPQGLRLAILPALVLVVFAALAVVVRRTRATTAGLAVVVVLAVVGPGIAGEVATRAKEAALPRVAPCVLPGDEDGVLDGKAAADVAQAQEAFDSLDHPSPFGGASATGVGGCTVALATSDLAAVLEFYGERLPAAGWTVVEEDEVHLVATSGDLTFTVFREGDQVQVSVTVP